MAVINTVELEGVSQTSWGDAAREALREAARTIRGITKLEVLGVRAKVQGDRITEYRTAVRLHFTVEPRR
ncbi:MAG TPA: dodecin domain-containing protein [Actinomycetota bacterium]|nr:dodecin domain-containing protein [Actinomycetota bacterium]